ncbi:sarcosine oxidase subunit gamma [Pseudoroseicyclus sp. CXY001]|uniref:sarcosine oxidase subunit gamma n=1 Tax=Pseudoroseicyclus sp. CXY001 TaxID=3242492 RepID=UPI00357138F0
MARLFAAPAFAELPALPGLELREVDWGPVTEIAPFRGAEGDVSAALQAAHGIAFPAAGEAPRAGAARALWVGPGRALLIGVAPPDGLRAALTDQTGAQAVLLAEGAAVEAVLARLVPVDLSPEALTEGRTVRTFIGHMTASVTRVGAEAMELAVMRSMAGSLLHDLGRATKMLAARAG